MIIDNRFLNKLDVLPGQYLLDLGCGEGAHFESIRKFSPGLHVALDLDFYSLQKMVSCYSSLLNNPRSTTDLQVCANALGLPFSDETFDRVICSLVLYFLPFQTALKELHRIVKIGGKVYLRLPILAWSRIIYIFRYALISPHKSAYTALLLINGIYYYLIGKQLDNPFLRHERITTFIPRNRLEESIVRVGFSIDDSEITKPEPGTAAMDIWLTRIR